MHYFQFEIKEWVANTAHLSLEEEAAYLRLIFFYYDSERPIPHDDLSMVFRKCRVPEELGKGIMLEFFTMDGNLGAWTHKRCDGEIARYHAKHEQASRAGKASAQARFNARSTDAQPIINHKSSITNQESKNTKPPKVGTPDGVSDSVWQDFMAVRQAKKAKMTETALKGLVRESNKAGIPLEDAIRICCERGWVGFKADWIAEHLRNKPAAYQDKNVAAARAIFGDERRLPDARTIDIDLKKIT